MCGFQGEVQVDGLVEHRVLRMDLAEALEEHLPDLGHLARLQAGGGAGTTRKVALQAAQ